MDAITQIAAFLVIAPAAWFGILGAGRVMDRFLNR